jgi:hypothetical protein
MKMENLNIKASENLSGAQCGFGWDRRKFFDRLHQILKRKWFGKDGIETRILNLPGGA